MRKSTPMPVQLLQEKALQLNEKIKIEGDTFLASTGWLDRRKKRYEVIFG